MERREFHTPTASSGEPKCCGGDDGFILYAMTDMFKGHSKPPNTHKRRLTEAFASKQPRGTEGKTAT